MVPLGFGLRVIALASSPCTLCASVVFRPPRNRGDRVVQATDVMCQAIQKLNQKELWWVQQWVNEAKLKYNMKNIRTYTDNVHPTISNKLWEYAS